MMKIGCYTALITPFTAAGELDHQGLDQLVQFQIENNITGILATGTTGESPTLKWEEHLTVISDVADACKDKCQCVAGAGSNNTAEAINAVAHSRDEGVDAVLVVDPYYNGPSSLEIRREYYEPLAKEVSDVEIIPYIIPGRTGAQMLPEDLAILSETCPNVNSVKEATGNIDNMKRTRTCCGDDFMIFSGDDVLTCQIMSDPEIKASGGISVLSNIVPGAITDMVMLHSQGKVAEAQALNDALAPLLGLVVVTTQEKTPHGTVACRARNPLALKTLMQILGVPSGPCRRPIGKMTEQGIDIVVSAAKKVQADNPELLAPLAKFFNVDIDDRLDNPEYRKDLFYTY